MAERGEGRRGVWVRVGYGLWALVLAAVGILRYLALLLILPGVVLLLTAVLGVSLFSSLLAAGFVAAACWFVYDAWRDHDTAKRS